MRTIMILLALPAAMGTAAAQQVPDQPQTSIALPANPDPDAGTVIPIETDRANRMTVPVSIDGKGPYRFTVDTGAERTIISRELAGRLDLDEGRRTRLHSITEVKEVGTVVVPDLTVDRTGVSHDVHAPALLQRNIGAEGMLGVDTLKSRRVLFDFKKGEMTVTPSASTRRSHPDEIVIKGKSLFGRLVLMDAEIDGQRLWVVIDSGSEISIGNMALRNRLVKRHRVKTLKPVELISVTGGSIIADYARVKTLRIGGADLSDMPMAFADVHPFAKLQLLDRPAMLLGMNALRAFRRVSIDFETRQVRMVPDGSSLMGRPAVRSASASARPGRS